MMKTLGELEIEYKNLIATTVGETNYEVIVMIENEKQTTCDLVESMILQIEGIIDDLSSI
jgi:hypothetical protein